MRLRNQFIHSHWLLFLLISVVILGLNVTPLITHIRHAPEGRTFAMIHNNAQDFFFYQALMREGSDGAWLTKDPFTSEPHQPAIIFAYFLWLGKLASLLHISLPVMYHATRIIFGFLTLLAAYYLILATFPSPLLTFFFFVFAGGFFHNYNGGSAIISVPFMHWWTGVDPIRRAAYLPHHMIGAFLLILSLGYLVRFFQTGSLGHLLWAALLAPLMAFIHTPSLFIILLILPPTVALSLIDHFIRKRPLSNFKFHLPAQVGISNYIYLIAYWLIGAGTMGIMLLQTNRGFPWSQYISWEKTLQFPLLSEFPGALGILFPFALIGIVTYLWRGGLTRYLIVCWLVIPYLFLPIAPLVGMSNIRLIQGVPYLPLAILAVAGVETIMVTLERLAKKQQVHLTNLRQGVMIMVLTLFTVLTVPVFIWSLNDQIHEYWPIFGNIYFDNRLLDAFTYMNQHYPPGTITLGTFYTGNYLPAHTHTVSFIGHYGYTQNVAQKEAQTEDFFSKKITPEQARIFLTNNHIDLIVQGPEEKPIYSGKLYPEVLTPVYDTDAITLYILKR